MVTIAQIQTHRRALGCLTVMVVCALVAAIPSSLRAQAVLTGYVSDTAALAVFGARVSIDGTTSQTQTDEKGFFRIAGVPPGRRSVHVVRLGFRPVDIPVQIELAGTAEIKVVLTPVVVGLPTVLVRPGRVRYSGRLAGYYKRLESKSGGYFITREDIDRDNPSTTGQLLRRIPAIQVVRGRGGITGIRMRNRRCWPLVWVDGMPMPAGEVDIDAFVPSSIQGIELYLGATTAPLAFTLNEAKSSCGTILIWSRGPDTDPVHRAVRPLDIERLLAGKGVYTTQTVDRSAYLDSTKELDLQFPPSLFASHTPGLVIVEFVVDASGRVEENTVGVVSSTAPLFTDAVRVALSTAAFIPALKDGKPVRQLVHQPFEFDVEKGGARSPSVRQ